MGKREKPPKETKEQITAVDKQFYELTITDLNNKLAHLRSHTTKLEELNDGIETQMAQLEEDRSDVTAYLDRSLQVKVSNIKDLEEKLSELAKVRAEETADFLRQIKEGELKFKTMQEELTSEIKLLTGKLNSLEEFRIQKDELLAKFDQQETELREQTKRHRDIIYEIERKQVVDKDRLKKEVENKLLQLSNEFAKSNEIRISAHVQRLVRENIALNNELDRMMFSQRRLQNENNTLREVNVERKAATNTVMDENLMLVKTSDNQLEIIKQLTNEYEKLRHNNAHFIQADSIKQAAERREHTAVKELNDYKHKVHLLEQHVHAIRTECLNHHTIVKQQASEMERLTDILQKLKFTVKSAARSENDAESNELRYREVQRKHLLSELMKILITVDDAPKIVSSFETVSTIAELYQLGDIGITPQHSLYSILNLGRPISKMQRSRLAAAEQIEKEMADETATVKSYECFPIIDLDSSSALLLSESSQGAGDGQPPDEDGLEVEDEGASSSDDDGKQKENHSEDA